MKNNKLSEQIVSGLTEASPILLLLAFFACLIYVGVLQQEYYAALFQTSMPGKAGFVGWFVAIGVGLSRMAGMFSSVALYRLGKLGQALLLLFISISIAFFEHFEAVPMAAYYAEDNNVSKDAFQLLYQASVWFTIPIELAIAFVYSATTSVKEEVDEDSNKVNTASEDVADIKKVVEDLVSQNQVYNASKNGSLNGELTSNNVGN